MKELRKTFVAIAIVSMGAIVLAQEPVTQPTPQELSLETPAPAPESIDEDLADAEERPAGLFKYGPVSLIDTAWDNLNRQTEEIGLNVGLAYTMVFQATSGGPGERQALGGDTDLFGDWRLLGKPDGLNNGYLYFAAEYRNACTEIAPNELGGQIGSLWGTTNGFGEQDLTFKEVYWQQHFSKDRLIVRVGKIDAENYYNSNYWQSDSKYFMNKAFSSFPVRAFPSNGLGMNLTAKLSDQWYISTGAQDAQGKKTTTGFDTFFNDFDLFGAGELGYTPTIEGWGRGNYRFTGWYRAAGESDGTPHDAGFVFSCDQRMGPHWIPFFRYGIGEGNINGIEQMISGGAGWEGHIISQSDIVGVAGAWGQPSDDDLRDQYAIELFYRLQVSPDNQFTVGYQVILDPSNDPDSDVVGVFEMRWRISM
jgi:hypothetical protein